MKMILPTCKIELTNEQESLLQPLFDAVDKNGFVPRSKSWAIFSQSFSYEGGRATVEFVIVREIARKGIAAIAQADRRERGEIL